MILNLKQLMLVMNFFIVLLSMVDLLLLLNSTKMAMKSDLLQLNNQVNQMIQLLQLSFVFRKHQWIIKVNIKLLSKILLVLLKRKKLKLLFNKHLFFSKHLKMHQLVKAKMLLTKLNYQVFQHQK